MSIDVRTPEDRERELRNISLMQARKHLERAKADIEYLIMATPTGDRRNAFTDANIHIMSAMVDIATLKSEEKPQ